MIFIMLSESNEFGKKVRGDMAFVRSGNNCNESYVIARCTSALGYVPPFVFEKCSMIRLTR